jgi:hypothetical protein
MSQVYVILSEAQTKGVNNVTAKGNVKIKGTFLLKQ